MIAARNEQRDVAPALTSRLALDDPDLDVVLVDDGTARIPDRLGAGDCRLRMIHLMGLPVGWFGKN